MRSPSEGAPASPDPIEEHIVVALRRIVRAIDLQSRRMVDTCGLTGPQVVVLRGIASAESVSISALARSISLSQPTVSGIVERLEKRGLVRREKSDRDRRSVVVTLTPGGDQVLRGAPSMLQDRFQLELSKLAEWERTQMLSTLQRLAAMMDAETLDAAPLLETGAITAPAGAADPASGAQPKRATAPAGRS